MQSRISKDLVVPGELYVALEGACFLREESVFGSSATPRDEFGIWDLKRRTRLVLLALTSIKEYSWFQENGKFLLFKALYGEEVLYVIVSYSDGFSSSYKVEPQLVPLRNFFEADRALNSMEWP